MSRFQARDTRELVSAVSNYLSEFPGETICARQIWYECLGGCGIPHTQDMEAMHSVLDGLDEWEPVGDVRYEKFGTQYSYRRKN